MITEWERMTRKYSDDVLDQLIFTKYIDDPEKGLKEMSKKWGVSTQILSRRLQREAAKTKRENPELYRKYKRAYELQRAFATNKNYTPEWVKLLLENRDKVQLAEKIVDIYIECSGYNKLKEISGLTVPSLRKYIIPYLGAIPPQKAAEFVGPSNKNDKRHRLIMSTADNIVTVMILNKDLFLELPDEIQYSEFVELMAERNINASVLECLYAAKEFNCKVVRDDKYIHNRWENEGGRLDWLLGLDKDGKRYLRVKAYKGISAI